jgi:toxin secretion/phage lysis holin
LKEVLCTVVGVVGAFIARLYGGWDAALTTLVIFMGIDFVTGLMVAGFFKKSDKSQNGALDSKASFKGLCKKAVIMLIVLMAYRLDLAAGSTFIKDATIIAFITNETISIIENAAAMGIPIPAPILQAIDILRKKGEHDQNGNTKDVSDTEQIQSSDVKTEESK